MEMTIVSSRRWRSSKSIDLTINQFFNLIMRKFLTLILLAAAAGNSYAQMLNPKKHLFKKEALELD